MRIFKISDFVLSVAWWGCSLGRYDDGLQKPIMCRKVEPICKEGNEDNLELSTSPRGETRRSEVQILTAPPKSPSAKINNLGLSIWRNRFGASSFAQLLAIGYLRSFLRALSTSPNSSFSRVSDFGTPFSSQPISS